MFVELHYSIHDFSCISFYTLEDDLIENLGHEQYKSSKAHFFLIVWLAMWLLSPDLCLNKSIQSNKHLRLSSL